MPVTSINTAKERQLTKKFSQGMLDALAERKAQDAVIGEMNPMSRVPAAELWAAIHSDQARATEQAEAILWDDEHGLNQFFGQRLLDCEAMSLAAGFRIAEAESLAEAYLSIPDGMRGNLPHGCDHGGVVWQ